MERRVYSDPKLAKQVARIIDQSAREPRSTRSKAGDVVAAGIGVLAAYELGNALANPPAVEAQGQNCLTGVNFKDPQGKDHTVIVKDPNGQEIVRQRTTGGELVITFNRPSNATKPGNINAFRQLISTEDLPTAVLDEITSCGARENVDVRRLAQLQPTPAPVVPTPDTRPVPVPVFPNEIGLRGPDGNPQIQTNNYNNEGFLWGPLAEIIKGGLIAGGLLGAAGILAAAGGRTVAKFNRELPYLVGRTDRVPVHPNHRDPMERWMGWGRRRVDEECYEITYDPITGEETRVRVEPRRGWFGRHQAAAATPEQPAHVEHRAAPAVAHQEAPVVVHAEQPAPRVVETPRPVVEHVAPNQAELDRLNQQLAEAQRAADAARNETEQIRTEANQRLRQANEAVQQAQREAAEMINNEAQGRQQTEQALADARAQLHSFAEDVRLGRLQRIDQPQEEEVVIQVPEPIRRAPAPQPEAPRQPRRAARPVQREESALDKAGKAWNAVVRGWQKRSN